MLNTLAQPRTYVLIKQQWGVEETLNANSKLSLQLQFADNNEMLLIAVR